MTDRRIIETMSQADCEAAEIAMWADMLDMCREERDAALARAEAADARAEQFRTERDTWERLNDERYKELAQLRARVTELEAQLAAQGWRPVTEKPDKPGWYVVYDSDGHVFYNADIFPYRVARWTGKWDSAFNGLVDYWRPLPPAPQEPTP
jgi:hypothetical protein